MKKAVEWDTATDNFELELFIKNKLSASTNASAKTFDAALVREEIKSHLVTYFPYINIIQKEGMANSKLFPEIDFENFSRLVARLEEYGGARPGAGTFRDRFAASLLLKTEMAKKGGEEGAAEK